MNLLKYDEQYKKYNILNSINYKVKSTNKSSKRRYKHLYYRIIEYSLGSNLSILIIIFTITINTWFVIWNITNIN